MKNNKKTSYLMLLSSMLIFGSIGIFRRAIPLSSALLAAIRGFLGGLLLLILSLFRKKTRERIGFSDGCLLALAGALMGLNWLLLFEAYNNTTVAVATLCYYMEPTIVILLSALFFAEKLTGKKLACAIVSVAGMVLVSGVAESGGVSPGGLKGILFGLGAALLYSSVVLLNKKIEVEDDFGRTVIELFAAAAVLLPVVLRENFAEIRMEAPIVCLILLVGIVHTGLAYALYFSGMKALPAQSVAILSYVDPVSALIFAAIFLDEKLSLPGLLGAVLIIGAALVSEIDFRAFGNNRGNT